MKVTAAHDLPVGWGQYPYTLNGYRVQYTFAQALRSVFHAQHNEFWMIWSDIAPSTAFTCMMYYADNDDRAKMLMFFGAISCRACSLVYHIFNCVSTEANRRLIYVDLVGIASNALGVPYVARTASFNDTKWDTTWFLNIFCAMYVGCVLYFVLSANNHSAQKLLVGLAVAGNLPTLYAITDAEQPPYVRLCLLSGLFWFAAGYVLFYAWAWPNRYMPSGSADFKWWHSHVLWHVSSALGQLSFLATTDAWV